MKQTNAIGRIFAFARIGAPLLLLAAALGCASAARPAQDAPEAAGTIQPRSLDAYVLPEATFALHLRLGASRKTSAALGAFVAEFVKGFFGALAEHLHKPAAECAASLRTADEVVLSNEGPGRNLMVVRGGDPRALAACYGDAAHAVELRHGLFFAGTRESVDAAVAAPPSRIGPNDAIWRLGGDGHSLMRMFGPDVAGQVSLDQAVLESLVIDGADDAFHAASSFTAVNPAAADLLAARLGGIRDADLAPRGLPPGRLRGVLGRTEIARHAGLRVVVSADVRGDEVFAAVDWVRRASLVVQRLEQAEAARRVLVELAKRVVAYANDHRRAGRAMLPQGAPQTPKLGPDGKPGEADWSQPTWLALQFALKGAVRHGYSIRRAPSGRSVTLVAEADLDGNGKRSRIELDVGLRPDGQAEIADSFRERDPFELSAK